LESDAQSETLTLDLRMSHTSQLPNLIARLERIEPKGPCVLAFDGDGTLWSGDVGEDFFHFAIARQLIRSAALPALNDLARAHQVPLHAEPNAQALALFGAFTNGRLPERTACEMMAWCYAGWSPAALLQQIQTALVEQRLADRYFSPLRDVLSWARARGHRPVVVSASPHPVVVEAVRHLGFEAEDVAAGEMHAHEDLYTTAFKYPLPYADTKVSALKRLAQDLPILAAFGDNVFDLEMLREALVPVAVRPKAILTARLSELAEYALLA
jgi:HAD superfamily phosphoserine phosphatase-like hydrolase